MSSCPFEQGPMRAEILQLGGARRFRVLWNIWRKKRIITSQNCLISSISTVQVATLCLAENRGMRAWCSTMWRNAMYGALASRMSRLRSLGPFNTKATSCSSYWHLHSSSSTGLSAKTLLAFNPSQYQSHPLKKELQEVTALSSSSYLINYFSFVVINGQSFQTGIYVVPLSCRQRLRKASGGISPARELPMSSPVAAAVTRLAQQDLSEWTWSKAATSSHLW